MIGSTKVETIIVSTKIDLKKYTDETWYKSSDSFFSYLKITLEGDETVYRFYNTVLMSGAINAIHEIEPGKFTVSVTTHRFKTEDSEHLIDVNGSNKFVTKCRKSPKYKLYKYPTSKKSFVINFEDRTVNYQSYIYSFKEVKELLNNIIELEKIKRAGSTNG